MISIGFWNGNECFFERVPKVLVKSWSGCMTVGANTLKTSVISALIDGAPFCYGGLKTGGVGAENDLGSSVHMTVG